MDAIGSDESVWKAVRVAAIAKVQSDRFWTET